VREGRRHPRVRALQHRLTQPARRTALPVLRGPGRGLRIKAGESIIRVSGRGELAVEAALLGILRPGDVVYDIGANIGWYSVLAARAVGPSGSVVAFEPSLENALLAQQNAAVNGLENVTVVPAALTDHDGWMTLITQGSLEGRLELQDGSVGQGGETGSAEVNRMLVPVASLDTWLQLTGQPAPTLVKIDVEGAEASVLRGMRRTLQEARPTIIVELHGTREAVADELDAAGYEHRPIEREVPTREAPWWVHLLARPRAVEGA
jgi:FkbM family methyltransferase